LYDIKSYGPAKVAGEKGTYKLTVTARTPSTGTGTLLSVCGMGTLMRGLGDVSMDSTFLTKKCQYFDWGWGGYRRCYYCERD
jgi:hypothetical protein